MQAIQFKSYDYYDMILVAFSGGKDSLAMVANLIDQGVDMSRVELHHHDIDGREHAQDQMLMDWPSTPAYCKAFAAAFNLPIYFSWREGGFHREMMRDGTEQHGYTAAVKWERANGETMKAGGIPRKQDKAQARRMFPQVTADLSKRWCSASLKVDVMRRMVANDPRFNGKKILILTGERALESTARAKYAKFEVHATLDNSKRTVHSLRPVHGWTEQQVWDIIKRHGINPHPAYKLGWNRLSCALCIFGGANQWASAQAIFGDRVAMAARLEKEFGKTIDRDGVDVLTKCSRGTVYAQVKNSQLADEARDAKWQGQIRVTNWQLPAGAFTGGSCGPQ